MKKFGLTLVPLLLALVICGYLFGAEWSNSTCSVLSKTQLDNGVERVVLKVTAVGDNSAGTVTLAGACLSEAQGAALVQIAIDPTGTLTAPANFTVVDVSGATLLDTDSCTNTPHVTNTVVLGDTEATMKGYDPPVVMGSLQLSIDDIGTVGATADIYLYLEK